MKKLMLFFLILFTTSSVYALATGKDQKGLSTALQKKEFQAQLKNYQTLARIENPNFAIYLLKDNNFAVFDTKTGQYFITNEFLKIMIYLKKYQEFFPNLLDSMYKPTSDWRRLFDQDQVRYFFVTELAGLLRTHVRTPIEALNTTAKRAEIIAKIAELDSEDKAGELKFIALDPYEDIKNPTPEQVALIQEIRKLAMQKLTLDPMDMITKMLQAQLAIRGADVSASDLLQKAGINASNYLAEGVLPAPSDVLPFDRLGDISFVLKLYKNFSSEKTDITQFEPEEKMILKIVSAQSSVLSPEQRKLPRIVDESDVRGLSLLPVNTETKPETLKAKDLANFYSMLNKAKVVAGGLLYQYGKDVPQKGIFLSTIFEQYRVEVVDGINDAVEVDYAQKVIRIHKNVIQKQVPVDQVILFLMIHAGLKAIIYEKENIRENEKLQIEKYAALLGKELDLFTQGVGNIDGLIAQFNNLKTNKFFISELEGRQEEIKGERFNLTFPDVLQSYKDRKDIFNALASAYAQVAWKA